MITQSETAVIVETGRGPSIAGTRTTVFSIMDSIKSGQSPEEIKHLFRISSEQLEAVLDYINRHREEVEREYSEIVQRSEKRRAHYEQVFRERSSFPPEVSIQEQRRLLRQKIAERARA